MDFPHDLLEFIRAHRDELTLSVYVEAAPTDPAARRNWRVHLRQGLAVVRHSLVDANADEQDAFERCAAEVLRRLPSDDTTAGAHGWACFAAAGGDTLALTLGEAAQSEVAWGLGVRVVPYLRAHTDGQALVVRIDRELARIARWRDGQMEALASLESHRPRDVATYEEEQRQRAELQSRHLHAVRDRIVALAQAEEAVLIGGAHESALALSAALPAAIASRTLHLPGLTMALSDGEAAPLIHDGLATLDLTRRTRRVTELRELAHAHGHAAVGLEGARMAAELGAIAELIFSEGAWRRQPEEVESLVQRALAEGASVALSPNLPDAALDGEGIIAGLRFPVPTHR